MTKIQGYHLTIKHIPKRCKKAQTECFVGETLEQAITKSKAFVISKKSDVLKAYHIPCEIEKHADYMTFQFAMFADRTDITELFEVLV